LPGLCLLVSTGSDVGASHKRVSSEVMVKVKHFLLFARFNSESFDEEKQIFCYHTLAFFYAKSFATASGRIRSFLHNFIFSDVLLSPSFSFSLSLLLSCLEFIQSNWKAFWLSTGVVKGGRRTAAAASKRVLWWRRINYKKKDLANWFKIQNFLPKGPSYCVCTNSKKLRIFMLITINSSSSGPLSICMLLYYALQFVSREIYREKVAAVARFYSEID